MDEKAKQISDFNRYTLTTEQALAYLMSRGASKEQAENILDMLYEQGKYREIDVT